MRSPESRDLDKIAKLNRKLSPLSMRIGWSFSNTFYEYTSNYDTEFMISLPCHILCVAQYQSDKDFSYKSGNMDFFELFIVYSGALTYSYQNCTGMAKSGDILFIDSSYLCEFRQVGDEPLTLMAISLCGTSPSHYYSLMSNAVQAPILFHSHQELHTLLAKIVFYMKYPSNKNIVLMVNTMSEIFTELYLSMTVEYTREPFYNHPQWFTDMINFIENQSLADITVREIANALNMSESHFYKIFREYTGATPYQYLLNLRITSAQTLLATTDDQIKSVAVSVGFHSVNHFITHFREATGYTPLVYRKIRKL